MITKFICLQSYDPSSITHLIRTQESFDLVQNCKNCPAQSIVDLSTEDCFNSILYFRHLAYQHIHTLLLQ